jgi:DNA modification methylase
MQELGPLFDMSEQPNQQNSSNRIAPVFDPQAQVVLYQGEALDYLKSVPDESVKLVVTSPPYNIGKSYESRVSIDAYLRTQTEVIRELYRVLRPDGSICWQVGNYVDAGEVFPLDIYFYPVFKNLGMQLRNRIVWGFGHGLHATRRFSGRYETLLWFSKTDRYLFNLDPVRVPSKYPGKRHYKGPRIGEPSGNPLGKNPSDVWEVMLEEWECGFWDLPNVKSNHPEKTAHPCQFPVELVERCVLSMSEPGDWVYDPYAGVGTTVVAAIRQGRRGMGSEKEADYVAIATSRVNEVYAGTLRVRKLGTPVHVPSGREKVSQVPNNWQNEATRSDLFDSQVGDE